MIFAVSSAFLMRILSPGLTVMVSGLLSAMTMASPLLTVISTSLVSSKLKWSMSVVKLLNASPSPLLNPRFAME